MLAPILFRVVYEGATGGLRPFGLGLFGQARGRRLCSLFLLPLPHRKGFNEEWGGEATLVSEVASRQRVSLTEIDMVTDR